MKPLKAALLQLTSVDSVDKNLEQVFAQLEQVRTECPDLICLPENALYMRLKDTLPIHHFSLLDDVFLKLQKYCDENKCAIHVGSVSLMVPESKPKGLVNASVLLCPNQKPQATYFKIHLFDIELEGLKPNRESDVFDPGSQPSVFEWRGWKFGQSICYDLRFSELYSYYAKQSVDVILVPAAFLIPTGKAHWHVLLRARAIESQCYVLAAAQGGEHLGEAGSRGTYGHSMVVGPWGEILDEVRDDSMKKYVIYELQPEAIQKVRKQIPMAAHRRI